MKAAGYREACKATVRERAELNKNLSRWPFRAPALSVEALRMTEPRGGVAHELPSLLLVLSADFRSSRIFQIVGSISTRSPYI